MKKYEIKKDLILKCWLVWELHSKCKVEVFRSKYKKDCIKYVKENRNESNRFIKQNSK